MGSRRSVPGQPALKRPSRLAPGPSPGAPWVEWHLHPAAQRSEGHGGHFSLTPPPPTISSHVLPIGILGITQSQLFSSCTRSWSPSQLGILLAWQCPRSPLSVFHSPQRLFHKFLTCLKPFTHPSLSLSDNLTSLPKKVDTMGEGVLLSSLPSCWDWACPAYRAAL